MNYSCKKKKEPYSADTFADSLPGRQQCTDDIFFRAHNGPSMNPILNEQDLLEIKPYIHEVPRAGDVIFFQPPGHNYHVVHRIISISTNGSMTRGDNCNNDDPWLLETQNIYGRIIAAHRVNKRRVIAGGLKGRLTGISCQVRRQMTSLIVKLLGPVYRSFCTDGFLHWLIPVRLVPRVATFQSDSNAAHRLLLGKRIIGTYNESLFQWQIRRPYRLFVDESSLPTPE